MTVTYTRRSERSQHSPKGDRTQKKARGELPVCLIGLDGARKGQERVWPGSLDGLPVSRIGELPIKHILIF